MSRGPVIIIEGPDGAGKTHLARNIQENWNHHPNFAPLKRGRWAVDHGASLVYLHQGPYTGDPLVQTINLLERHRGAVICDRLHIGEQVYGPVYRQRDALGAAGRRMLERYLLARGAVLVLALPPFKVAHANWAKRKAEGGEMFPDEAGYRAVYDGFCHARTQLPRYLYDYAMHYDATSAVLGWVRSTLAGSRSADVLLVGERPGTTNPIRGATPFTARGGCSEWLAERLDDGNVAEGRLAWLNAETRDGRQAPVPDVFFEDGFLAPVYRPKVVALGKVADAWCAKNLSHISSFTSVPHPQAWKRFHHNETYTLIPLLQELTRARRPARNDR